MIICNYIHCIHHIPHVSRLLLRDDPDSSLLMFIEHVVQGKWTNIYMIFTHVLSALPFLFLAIRLSSGSPCYHSPSHAPLISFPWLHHCKFPWRHCCFSLTSRVDLVFAGVVIFPASLAGCCWETAGRRSSSSCSVIILIYHACFIALSFTPFPIYKDFRE